MQKDLEEDLIQQCLRDFRKYADTVTVSAAVCHLFKENKDLGRYMGIEPKLNRIAQTPVTPDLAILYDNDAKGILFEIKWSLPQTSEWMEKKLKELKKYFDIFVNWKNGTGRVESHDVVLICHPEDSDNVLQMIKKISSENDYECFKNVGFSIWTWLLNPPKGGERSEQLRLIKLYGQTRNIELERKISNPLGILVPEEVLTFLRFTYFIIKEEPPIQYLLNILIINVLLNPVALTYENFYEVDTDWIWNKAKSHISMGEEYDEHSLQIKRRWIRDSLNTLLELQIIQKDKKDNYWKIPTNLFRYVRKPIQEIICIKLVKRHIQRMKQLKKELPILGSRRTKTRLSGKESKLTDYIKKDK